MKGTSNVGRYDGNENGVWRSEISYVCEYCF